MTQRLELLELRAQVALRPKERGLLGFGPTMGPQHMPPGGPVWGGAGRDPKED